MSIAIAVAVFITPVVAYAPSPTTPTRRTRLKSTTFNLEDAVRQKLWEADKLAKQHDSLMESDVKRRMSFTSVSGGVRFGKAMRRKEGTAVVADIKRQYLDGSKTGATFSDASAVAGTMLSWPVDAVSIGLASYGGTDEDLRATRRKLPDAAILAKDLVVDPVQIGVAAELGADAVFLIASVLGNRLEDLLDVATICGVEAVVEVHTPNECRFALEAGATTILVNNYDRVQQKLVPTQARGLRDMIPPNILALATGGITNLQSAKYHVQVGYDALFLGNTLLASSPTDSIPLVKAIRDFRLSPAEAMLHDPNLPWGPPSPGSFGGGPPPGDDY